MSFRDVRPYDMPDFSKKRSADKPEVRPFQEPKFETHQPAEVADSIHKKAESFKLDRLVVEQLGIEKRENEAQEERIRHEIERRWEKMAEKAEVEGFTRGLEEGKAEAYKAELPRIRERVEKLDFLLQEFDKFREKIFSANEAFLMDLIAQIAGTVVLREVQVDRDYIRRLVMTLLAQLGTREDIKIHLSQFDAENVEMLREAIGKEFGKLNNTSIEISDEIPAGGCKIETNFGVVDASIAAQIENVQKAMKG